MQCLRRTLLDALEEELQCAAGVARDITESSIMLTVTDAALQHLHNALSRSATRDADSNCFRMTIQDNDTVGLRVQQPESDDHTFECEGATVLATPESLSELLSERVLDLDEQGQLVLVPKVG